MTNDKALAITLKALRRKYYSQLKEIYTVITGAASEGSFRCHVGIGNDTVNVVCTILRSDGFGCCYFEHQGYMLIDWGET
jgi:hypothetical protein